MPARTLVLLVALGAATAASCTEPKPSFDLVFHEDSVEVYDLTYCHPADMYCRRPVASSKLFNGTLDVGARTLTIDGRAYTSEEDVHLDSLPVEFIYTPFPCGRYLLRAVQSNTGRVKGTWLGQYDCHGLSGKGYLERP